MIEQPDKSHHQRQISVRSLVGSIMLVAGLAAWFGLAVLILSLGDALGAYLRLLLDLADAYPTK